MTTPTFVHRLGSDCHWTPTAITALAADPDGDRLAVCRSSGEIEIHRRSDGCLGAIVAVLMAPPALRSHHPRSAVWCAGALWTGGLDGRVARWGGPGLACEAWERVGGGGVWAVAEAGGGKVACACDDGTVRVVEADGAAVRLVRVLPCATGARALSIAWHPIGEQVVVGASDGSLRWLCPRTGTVHQRADCERKAAVWAVAVSAHGVGVGLQSGTVQMWNSRTGTLERAFDGVHAADVYALCSTGRRMWSGGADGRVVSFFYAKSGGAGSTGAGAGAGAGAGSSGAGGVMQWLQGGDSRCHSHDVQALCLLSGSRLLSGGLDTLLGVHRGATTADFGRRSSRLSPYHRPAVLRMSGPSGRVLVEQHAGAVLYEMPTVDSDRRAQGTARAVAVIDMLTDADRSLMASAVEEHDVAPNRATDDGMLQGPEFNRRVVLASAVSPSGDLVAVSTSSRLRVVRLVRGQLRAMKLPEACSGRLYRCLEFDADSQRLCAAHGELVDVIDVPSGVLLGTVRTHARVGRENAGGAGPITHLAVSPSGELLASADAANRIFVHRLETLELVCTVPTRPLPLRTDGSATATAGDRFGDGDGDGDGDGASVPLTSSMSASEAIEAARTSFGASKLVGALLSAMAFHGDARLVVTTWANTLHVFDCAAGGRVDEDSLAVAQVVSAKLSVRRDSVVRGVASMPERNSLVLWGEEFFCHVRLDTPAEVLPSLRELGQRNLSKKAFKKAKAAAAAAAGGGGSGSGSGSGRKRTRSNSTGSHSGSAKAKDGVSKAVRIVQRFKPLIGMGVVRDEELVVWEQPWVSVLADIGVAPLWRKRYNN